ncbi:lethal(2) giant larvae protein homolog 1 isoform X2 [Rhopalosiphum maidis]|uniref:lethal(2) giant larvae protein homolog 1 isoform X2 n=1 Tax=Rhopalosiphum maidis TaxID=43146 RepID=UPI000F007C5D|nr:lethal(2) giant larvae protein homolog 1 isoform X2 [Rhopalosiphum maidis]
MLKFIRGKGQQPSVERQKIQKDLFAFRRTLQYGFPNKPTALSWDPLLRIMAIGTSTGSIKVLGKTGVEFYGHLPCSDHAITKLIFVPNQGRLVSLSDDNSLHYWEINDMAIDEVQSYLLEGKLKQISAMCLESNCENLLLGTEGGNIFFIDLSTFELSDNIIYQDVVMQKVSDEYKKNPGAVEVIAEQPGNPNHILIAYSRGLIVLWDRLNAVAVKTFVSSQQVESVCWEENGESFYSSHNDGSVTLWKINETSDENENTKTIYGPFPCKPISKVICQQSAQDLNEQFLIFSGGMPRACYGDRHAVTVRLGTTTKHVAFELTSKVIDFFTATASIDEKGCSFLMILAEEEIVCIDLSTEDWPLVQLPYLVSIHASAITFTSFVSDLNEDLWNNIIAIGNLQNENNFSSNEWPVDGGEANIEDEQSRDLLITGHEDGSVKLWVANATPLLPIHVFKSSWVLVGDDADNHSSNSVAPEEDEEEWPPFRKVGNFDPYSDDPRLAIKKVILCPRTGTMIVAGTAGHVIVTKFNDQPSSNEIKAIQMNVVGESFIWKGHERLSLKQTGDEANNNNGKNMTCLTFKAGFQPSSVLQVYPPASITAVALHSNWSLVAAGTAHGLVLYDYYRQAPVLTKCTLNPNDLSTAGDTPISRRKSFKKSLRESFRRLRKGRNSTRIVNDKKGASITPDKKRENTGPISPMEARPVERAIEARPVDDALGSMVRCLSFTKTFIVTASHITPTMWAGTNNGSVYIFTISIPPSDKRKERRVTAQLGKEVQLKHRAPVIGITVIDAENRSVTEVQENNTPGKPLDICGPHKVIIASEEQFKIFSLPNLKPLCKLKLTAAEGARVRRMSMAYFKTSDYAESCLLCLTNLGEVIVLSVPDLRRQIHAAVIRREDINGISSLAFTRYGEALYLHSSSELQRISVSATSVTQVDCSLNLPTRDRPSNSHSITPINGYTDDEQEDFPKVNGLTNGTQENGDSNSQLNNSNDLSVGDITIDSIKDHLGNSNTNLNVTSTSNNVDVNNHQKTVTKHELSSTTTTTVKTSNSTTVITNETITVDNISTSLVVEDDPSTVSKFEIRQTP